MEKLNPIPVFKRFGVQVLLFNVMIILGIIAPSRTINHMNYKYLVDRISFHASVFDYYVSLLSWGDSSDWQSILEDFPGILYQQRISIFNTDKELLFDTGPSWRDPWKYNNMGSFELLLPDPYIRWGDHIDDYDTSVYFDQLQTIDIEGLDPEKHFRTMLNIQYPDGMDRIILSGRAIMSSNGEMYIVVLSDSVVDMLIHERAVKERFLFLYSIVVLLAVILSLLMNWLVTNPLKRLYRVSERIVTSNWKGEKMPFLSRSGEIGIVCQAIQQLLHTQKIQADNFRMFSSDIIHELKTPLAAIRSGIELYSETENESDKDEMFQRINKRIKQMENLMDEIKQIGVLETDTNEETCDSIPEVIRDVLCEYADFEIVFELIPEIKACKIPIIEDKLYQIVNNLLKNAVSFSNLKGSVFLSVSLKEGFLQITVRDKGPGIPDPVFSSITSRFFSYRPGKNEHSGLGLAIVDAILRNCGGKLEYRNIESGGAEFTVFIPCV